MASNAQPVRLQEILQLTALGINSAHIGFATLTMESPKYICVREQATTADGKPQIAIIDLEKPQNINRRPITADSAIMNPTQNILALKAGTQLQVFNIEQRQKIKAWQLPEQVVFWKWLDSNTIGMVTNTSVFHWRLDGPEEPTKMFDRLPNLADCQIINYRADASQKWLCVVGISQKEGRIVGSIQLHSMERGVSQPIEGHAAAFGSYLPDGAKEPSTLFSFAKRTPTESKVYIFEVAKPDANPPFTRRSVDLFFPLDAAGDFPVGMQIGAKQELIYLVTKFGFLHVFDLETGSPIYRNKISTETIFVTCVHEKTGALFGVDRKGSVTVVSVDEQNFIPYVCTALNNYELAIRKASRCGLSGAEDLFTAQFNRLFQAGDARAAAKVAAESPNGILRTAKTIQMFQALPTTPGQPSPLLQYFSVVMEKGKLNNMESLELARPVLAQGRKDLLEKWLKEDKLAYSEELGDLVRTADPTLALSIYFKAGAHQKVVAGFAETGQHDKIIPYCQQVNYRADNMAILNTLIISNPEAAGNFAFSVINAPGGAMGVDVPSVIDLMIKRGMIPAVTKILLEFLKNNKPEEAGLQTKLLEINLLNAPNVADAILGNNMFTHFDRPRVAQLCERAGLYQRALELYTDINDIKRAMTNTQAIQADYLVGYFGRLSPDDGLECLRNLLRINMRQNMQLVVQICAKYSTQMTPEKIIDLFEQFKCVEGLFFYLGNIIAGSESKVVHNKYIEAAARIGQVREVERIVRESNLYDPAHIRDFLKEAKLPDQLPLIIVCDRFDFMDDLTKYLYKNNMSRYIEAYVQRINPSNTPIVVGALIDVGCNEDYIKNLLLSVRSMCPVEPLVEVVEKRNKLKIILPWIEQRVNEGSQEAELHNAYAKIIIDSNKNPEEFLQTNKYYDARVVGKYCEKRDPLLAFSAYKAGQCDDELLELTNKNQMWKQQARYLVGKMDKPLWAKVLTEENEFRRNIIDQVVQTALPEAKTSDEVTVTVTAFMEAQLPNELIELLEKIVFSSKNKEFSESKSIQNLLILTAVRVDKTKVMDYIIKLDKYEAGEIAAFCTKSDMFEEAFAIYNKFKMHVDAVTVLIKYLHNLEKAQEFADRLNSPEVYKELGNAQLEHGAVKAAIQSFLKANNADACDEVIFRAATSSEDLYEEFVKYLEMCHKKIKSPKVETELVFAYAKIHKLAEMETFICTPGCTANLLETGDRCFDQGLYEAAKIVFQHISNWPKLASSLLKLHDYNAAIEAAHKAGTLRTWKEVNFACVDAKEFKLAQTAGLQIITHPDEIEEVTRYYEERGYFAEVIQLFEHCIVTQQNGESLSPSLFTELACLYSKYKEEKLMDYLKSNIAKVIATKLANFCQLNSQWKELVFLYVHEKEFDNACMAMINHSVECWDHAQFKDACAKVSNVDICYRGIQYYLGEQPALVNDLLTALINLLDHGKVVALVRRSSLLALVKPYLVLVQDKNLAAVNEALHELYVEEEDHESLRASVDKFNNFDQLALATTLESHALLEFRRIAAYIYKKNGKFAQSIELSKKDKIYRDAIQTAAESKKQDIAESLLEFFIKIGQKECFAAALYTCYDLLRPDLVLELGWRHGLTDFVFPYMIQVLREYTHKVDVLHKELENRKKEEEKKNATPDAFSGDPNAVMPPFMGTNTLAIAYYPDNSMPPMGMPPMGVPPPMGGLPPMMGMPPRGF